MRSLATASAAAANTAVPASAAPPAALPSPRAAAHLKWPPDDDEASEVALARAYASRAHARAAAAVSASPAAPAAVARAPAVSAPSAPASGSGSGGAPRPERVATTGASARSYAANATTFTNVTERVAMTGAVARSGASSAANVSTATYATERVATTTAARGAADVSTVTDATERVTRNPLADGTPAALPRDRAAAAPAQHLKQESTQLRDLVRDSEARNAALVAALASDKGAAGDANSGEQPSEQARTGDSRTATPVRSPPNGHSSLDVELLQLSAHRRRLIAKWDPSASHRPSHGGGSGAKGGAGGLLTAPLGNNSARPRGSNLAGGLPTPADLQHAVRRALGPTSPVQRRGGDAGGYGDEFLDVSWSDDDGSMGSGGDRAAAAGSQSRSGRQAATNGQPSQARYAATSTASQGGANGHASGSASAQRFEFHRRAHGSTGAGDVDRAAATSSSSFSFKHWRSDDSDTHAVVAEAEQLLKRYHQLQLQGTP